MKQIITTLAFSLITTTTFAQVGIGTNAPHASAILDLTSDVNSLLGYLPPRLSTPLRDLINGGDIAVGLVFYNTSVNCLQWYIGNGIWHNSCGNNLYQEYPKGYVFCESGPTEIVEVTSVGGRIWMDRNLGASQAATSYTDANSYGDLYQWGRSADGHQCRTSPLHDGDLLGLATTSIPNTGQAWYNHFITLGSSPFDWLANQDNFLWNTNELLTLMTQPLAKALPTLTQQVFGYPLRLN